MAQAAARDTPINIRARKAQRELIDRAAAVLHKNRSDFMLEVACREAENVLLDQRFFSLDGSAFDEFDAALKKPVADNPHIQELLARKAPWEK